MNAPTEIRRPTGRMERLAGFARRRHWTALLAWVILLAGVSVAAQAIGDDYGNGSDVSLAGTQSQEVADLIRAHSPRPTGDGVTVVLHDEQGWSHDLDLEALTDDLGAVGKVVEVVPPSAAAQTISADGTTALVRVFIDADDGGAPMGTYEQIRDRATSYASGDLQVELSGKGIKKLEKPGGGVSEGVGLLAALVILILMFGSLLAASLPLITAVLSVGTTIGLVVLLSHWISIADFTPSLLALVGLGVGIDYALIIFSRYRSELLHGADRDRAATVALATAGRSVLFAAASVVIAMAGMLVLGIPSFEGMIVAVALTVLVTMLASLTLLPALLTVFGGRIEARVRKHAAKTRREPGERWRRWAGAVQRRPLIPLLASVAALVALAAPVLGMRLGLGDAGTDPGGTTTRAAYDLVSEEFGAGANGPLLVLVRGSHERAATARATLLANTHIAHDRVGTPTPIADDLYAINADPTTGPQDAATADLVTSLREELGASSLVGGLTAANVDFSAKLAERFPSFVGVVVLLSAFLLLSVFRSIPIAIKAAVCNLLSIGAALGAMKFVYQDGRLWAEAGPIEAFMPVFIFAIVFGLSMDYEVFLMSRIREIWGRTGDAQLAVREGIAHTGGVITAAAAIMFAVFGAFALMPDRMLAQAGFAMAVAVLLDAVVIRCLMVPAFMTVLGARAWWLPRSLGRLLPHLDVEGAHARVTGGATS